jgi:hypothetical protein
MPAIVPTIVDCSPKIKTLDAGVTVQLPVQASAQVVMITWSPVDDADTCVGVDGLSHMVDKHVHVPAVGTVGSITIQGSDDGGTNWNTLHLADGTTALVITVAGFYQVMESPRAIRPDPGAATAAAKIILVGRIPVM